MGVAEVYEPASFEHSAKNTLKNQITSILIFARRVRRQVLVRDDGM